MHKIIVMASRRLSALDSARTEGGFYEVVDEKPLIYTIRLALWRSRKGKSLICFESLIRATRTKFPVLLNKRIKPTGDN